MAPGIAQFLLPQQQQAFGFGSNVQALRQGITGLTAGPGGIQAGALPAQAGLASDPLSQLRAATGVLGPEAQGQFFQGFQEDPGTQFLREQGLTGINQNLAASGGLGGGSRLKAISEFNQNLANQQLQQRLGQLGSLAQQDIGLATGLANLRTGLGTAQAQGLGDIGRATASGQVAAGQAAQQGFGQLAQLAGQAVGAAILSCTRRVNSRAG